MKAEDRLQMALEEGGAGEPGVSEEDAALLALAEQLRAVALPPRQPSTVAEQRAALDLLPLDQGSKSRLKGGRMNKIFSRWEIPLALAGGAVAVIAMFVVAALVIGGGFLWRFRTTEVAQPPLAATDAPHEEGAREEGAHDAYIPLVSGGEVTNAHAVSVVGARGEVEVWAPDGRWAPASVGAAIEAGQRVHTGALSEARLHFPDGSQAHLGARTEVAIEALTGEPRVVVLEQVAGQTLHFVHPDGAPGARYAVNTPAGMGEATGTIFGVMISEGGQARFSVDEGAVAVTGEGVTVQVQAGEVSTVAAGDSPSEPVFRISGEGELTAMGDVWTIGGQDFVVTEDTSISGDPQLGDWVAVDGRLLADDTRVADAIWVTSDDATADAERFEFTGAVEDIGAEAWVIAGVEVAVDAETEIEDGIGGGDLVKVEGVITEDGVWLATEIKLQEDVEATFEFVGTLESIDPWIVSGRELAVDDETEIEAGLAVGDLVKVEGVITEDGVWLAAEIKRVEPADEDGDEDEDGDGDESEPGLGSDIEMVTLCHKPDGPNPHTITVASPAVPAHLDHGDVLGPCEGTTGPGGRPESVPGGRPDGESGGPPEGVPGGPPDGIPPANPPGRP